MLKITIETSEDDGLIEDIHISFKYVDGKRKVSYIDSSPKGASICSQDGTEVKSKEKYDTLSSVNEEAFLSPKDNEKEEVTKPIIPDIKDRGTGEVPPEMTEQF